MSDSAARSVSTASEAGTCERRVIDLLGHLLGLASDIAPDSRSLGTEKFRAQLEHYRSQLSQATDYRHIDNLLSAAVRLCEEFFQRSQTYLVDREQEFRELIQMLRDALLSLAGDSQAFHGQLVETSARLNRLLELDDIRALKSRLTQEVEALKRTVEQRQREEQAHFSELTERVGALQSTLEQTKNQAALDAPTEVPNRGSFDDTLRGWIRSHEASKHSFILCMVDLDDFKHINDEHGHVVGDRVLKCAATALAEGIREEDFVARYGGEEFAVMLAGTSLKQAQERISELVQRIGVSRYKYRQFGEDRLVHFTVSAGLTEFARGDTPEQLVTRADDALYLAKKRGKNRVATKKKTTRSSDLRFRHRQKRPTPGTRFLAAARV